MQRIGLARALYGSPRIIVLDEPNANLDAEGDAALARAIKSLREAGSTVVVIAHRPSALAAVNKVMVVQDGMIVRFGEKDEVLAATTQNHGGAPAQGGSGIRAIPRRTGHVDAHPSQAMPANDHPQAVSANTPTQTATMPAATAAPGASQSGTLVLRHAPVSQGSEGSAPPKDAEDHDPLEGAVRAQSAAHLRQSGKKAAS